MSAPLGNQFWKLRSKHGRDRIFKDPKVLWESACEYFQAMEDAPLIELEQRKGAIIIQKGADTADLDLHPMVEMPKMRAFTLHGLCIFLDVSTNYFREFKKTTTQDFLDVITRIEDVCYNQKFTGAAAGFLNPNIIARDLGLADKKDVDKKVTKLNFKDAG